MKLKTQINFKTASKYPYLYGSHKQIPRQQPEEKVPRSLVTKTEVSAPFFTYDTITVKDPTSLTLDIKKTSEFKNFSQLYKDMLIKQTAEQKFCDATSVSNSLTQNVNVNISGKNNSVTSSSSQKLVTKYILTLSSKKYNDLNSQYLSKLSEHILSALSSKLKTVENSSESNEQVKNFLNSITDIFTLANNDHSDVTTFDNKTVNVNTLISKINNYLTRIRTELISQHSEDITFVYNVSQNTISNIGVAITGDDNVLRFNTDQEIASRREFIREYDTVTKFVDRINSDTLINIIDKTETDTNLEKTVEKKIKIENETVGGIVDSVASQFGKIFNIYYVLLVLGILAIIMTFLLLSR